MRAFVLRGFVFAVSSIGLVAGIPLRAAAQVTQLPPVAMTTDQIVPIISTRLEALLLATNVVLAADYYRIDTRFGPNMRIDAVVVTAVDSPASVKGLRVQVRDPDSRSRQEGTSFIDLDELTKLTRALTAMEERAAKWTLDDRRATELSFTTAGGFRIAIRESARLPRAYLSTGLLDPVVTSIQISELPTVRLALERALAILSGK
jgi:hypothetical protein